MDAFLESVYTAVLKPAIGLLFAIAFVVFIWGLVKFIKDKDSDEGRDTGKRNIIYGILGMLIMVSVFGIINIIAGTIGVTELPVDDSDLRKDIREIQVEGAAQ